MKIFFSAGEPSGDVHGANLIRALKDAYQGDDLQCVGFGGPKMKEAGAELMFDLTSLAVMWLGGVLWNIKTFFSLAAQAQEYFEIEKPDAVVLIDYPGFNWHIAKRAHKAGIPVYYYSPPQIWGWAQWRVRKMRKWVDCILSGLPFETQWFQDQGCRCIYVGHPFFDETEKFELEGSRQEAVGSSEDVSSDSTKNAIQIGILPGSRTQEVKQNIATMLKAARLIQERFAQVSSVPIQFRVAAFKDEHWGIIAPKAAKAGLDDIVIEVGAASKIMATSDAVMAVSGSVSLELLYYQVPTVILYKTSWLGMFLQSIFRKVKYITLVNLLEYGAVPAQAPDLPIAPNPRKALFPEFLTARDMSEEIADNIVSWISDPEEYERKREQLTELKNHVCRPGAAQKAADIILKNMYY
ncbi:MAG: lipid-A-disaccharide synthase [Thermoguttaceae bacterium]|nr:lipid-A-disaccharide synthase [Thermoguttaceae bacterium]